MPFPPDQFAETFSDVNDNNDNEKETVQPNQLNDNIENKKTALEEGSFTSMNNELVQSNYNSNDISTNNGTTEDTLDAAFHSALGVTRGNNLAGSNRADFYETPSSGKSDSEEELDALNEKKDIEESTG